MTGFRIECFKVCLTLMVPIVLLLGCGKQGTSDSMQLEGTLGEIFVDNFNSRHFERRYLLTTTSGEDYEVNLQPGTEPVLGEVRVSALQISPGVLMASKITSTSVGSQSYYGVSFQVRQEIMQDPVFPISGNKRLRVILVNLGELKAQQSAVYARQVMAQVIEELEAASQDKISLELVDVIGPITLDVTTEGCPVYLWTTELKRVLREEMGIPAVDHEIAIIPKTKDCTFGGTSTSPILAPYPTVRVIAHELGHHFRLGHAGWLGQGQTEVSAYGDATDVMGSAYHSVRFNALHQVRLGWEDKDTIQLLTKSRTYDVLNSAEPFGNRAKKLLFYRSETGDTNYYIAYHGVTDVADRLYVYSQKRIRGWLYDTNYTLGEHSMEPNEKFELDGGRLKIHFLEGDGRVAYVKIHVPEKPLPNPLGWHNTNNPLDTNNDGVVENLDALLVLNDLNANGSRKLTGENSAPPYLDVNNDGLVTPMDALQVINYLNRQ